MDADKAKQILDKVREIEIKTKRLMSEHLVGTYHSAFKGSGLNFSEVREYFAGDDIRSIDWNVTARTGTAHIKKFNEERETSIHLLVDISGSSSFGSGTTIKRERIAELAALLAFSALKNRDKVGLVLFSNCVELYIPPKKGRAHILRLIREILFCRGVSRQTNLATPLQFMHRICKRNCIAFLLSDFSLTSTLEYAELKPLLRAANSRYDLVATQIIDPHELLLPDLGWIRFQDAESSEQVELNSSDPVLRRQYQKAINERQDNLTKTLHRCGIDLLQIRTDQDYIPKLLQFFGQRRKRLIR